MLREKKTSCSYALLLLGGEPGRRRRAGRSALSISAGTAPGMLVWMPSSSGGACTPIMLGDDARPNRRPAPRTGV